jgi:anti-anti-sigma factor
MELNVRQVMVGSTHVLHVRGEIDLGTLPLLHGALMKFTNANPGVDLVVDVDGVSACDDAGLGVLLGAAGRTRETAADLVVLCSDGFLRSRLARTGFDRAVRVVDSLHLTSDQSDQGAQGAQG